MINSSGSLVQTSTKDGLILHGFFVPPVNDAPIIIFVHGFEGNFYENGFVHTFITSCSENGTGFLSINTRGNGKVTDFNMMNGEIKTIGGWHERLEDAWMDIDAWVGFVRSQGITSDIVLQGHSLGTMKVIRYFTEGNNAKDISKVVLLSPFDKNVLCKSETGRSVEELLPLVEKHISEGKGEELLESEGTKRSMSHNTFESWYKQDELGSVFLLDDKDFVSSVLSQITVPVFIAVGEKDEYFYVASPDLYGQKLDELTGRFPNAKSILIPGATHSYSPKEDELVESVLSFISA